MRILFITATRVGDAVLSTGLLAHLLATYPSAQITVACGPAASGLFEHMPRLDRLLIIDKLSADRHWVLLWWRVCRRWWDLVVDLRGSAVGWTIPARRRAVMRGGRRPGHRLGHLAAVLGLAQPAPPVVWTGAADRRRAEALLGPGPLIGLGPTANWAGKIWPAERFVALFAALSPLLPRARAVVFAGPGATERAAAAPVLAGLPGAVDLVGRLSLAEAASCLARCALFVGNDSGLMHLAAAAGTPTLGLFGPSRADEYAPCGVRAAAVAADGTMAGISVEAVVARAAALLGRPGEAPIRSPALSLGPC